MIGLFRTSRPDAWTSPRAHSDPTLRYRKHGPIQSMDDDRPSLLARLLGRRR